MPDMKRMNQKKIVQIEEVALQLDKQDIAEMITVDSSGDMVVDARDVLVCVSVPEKGDAARIGELQAPPSRRFVSASQLLEMARSVNPEIPENAEIGLALRWRKEVDATPAMMPAPASNFVPAPGRPATAAPAVAAAMANVPPGTQVAAEDTAQCATCGDVPGINGPTPECHDVRGCGRVRALRGDLPIAKTLEAANAPRVGMGHGAPGAGKVNNILINRETGQKAFADAKGQPYGTHDDYTK